MFLRNQKRFYSSGRRLHKKKKKQKGNEEGDAKKDRENERKKGEGKREEGEGGIEKQNSGEILLAVRIILFLGVSAKPIGLIRFHPSLSRRKGPSKATI